MSKEQIENQGWIRLIERSPQTDGRYLVFHDGGYDIVHFTMAFGFRKCLNTNIESWYWMPLPEPPKKEERSEKS